MYCKPYYSVIRFEVLPDYRIKMQFADGSVKTFDFSPLLNDELYAPLRNSGLFSQCRILCGGLAWTDEIDICPEFLYEQTHKKEA